MGLEFGGAGVDAFENGGDAQAAAGAADLGFVLAGQGGKAGVGEAHHLDAAQASGVFWQAIAANAGLGVDDFADAGEEPWVERGDLVDLVIGVPVAHGLGDDAEAVGGGFGEGGGDGGFVRCAGDRDFVKAGEAGFQACEGLLHALMDGAADCHHLAHRFHRGGEVGFRAGELFKSEPWDLGDHIIY